MSKEVVVKAQLGNHFRRLTVLAEGCKDADGWGYPALVAALRKAFAVKEGLGMRVQYMDDEGDWITMTSQDEFAEALRVPEAAESGSGPRVMRVCVDVVEVPATFSPSEPMDPMTSSVYSSLDIFALRQGSDDTYASSSSGATSANDDPPKELVEEYVSAIMDGSQPEFVPPSGKSASMPSISQTSSRDADLSVYVNEFHYYRLIIQTAITQSLRTMFDLPNSQVPNVLDNAVNELQFRRVIVQTAVESAFRTLFAPATPSDEPTSHSSHRPPLQRQRSLESIRQSLEPLLTSTAMVTESMIQSVHQRSSVMARQIIDAVQSTGEGEGVASDPLRDIRRSVENGRRTVGEMARSFVGGVGAFLRDVGERMIQEDPFGGSDIRGQDAVVRDGARGPASGDHVSADVEEEEEPLVRQGARVTAVLAPGADPDGMVERSQDGDHREETIIQNDSLGESERNEDPALLEVLENSIVQDKYQKTSDSTDTDIPLTEDLLIQMDDLDTTSSSDADPPTNTLPPSQPFIEGDPSSSLQMSYYSATSDLHHATSSIAVPVVDPDHEDAQNESNMSRVPDLDGDSDEEFVLVEEGGEEDGLGLRSSSLIFPVL
ncbi:hypothetical protein HDV00_006122 [Rhizophlyctis rosea]|nr:hypothetical protein HDV00_006122 [Rhizophlyctis rosea]